MTIAQQLEQKGILVGIREGMREGIREGIQLGREEGILLGEQRGKASAIHTVASKMLQRGIDDNMIMELTGLSAEELTLLSN